MQACQVATAAAFVENEPRPARAVPYHGSTGTEESDA